MIKNKIAKKILDIWYPDYSSEPNNKMISFNIKNTFMMFLEFVFKLILNISSLIYWFIIRFRKLLYKIKLFRSYKFNIPVIIVGNITVGGTGKTPCVIQLVKTLKDIGLKPAVVIRGYNNSKKYSLVKKKPFIVSNKTSIYKSGDEARMIYNATNCPVVVSSNRVKSIELLIKNKLANIIISDDGLQHYRLERDMEICIVDDARMFGNNKLLPSGPLREPIKRLSSCDYILSKINHMPLNHEKLGYNKLLNNSNCNFDIHTLLLSAINITNVVTNQKMPIKEFIKSYVSSENKHILYAYAGIGNNLNFFNTLSSLNINNIRYREFMDHYTYKVQDFSLLKHKKNIIITTEKDAVKINSIKNNIINSENIFYLSVVANFDYGFIKEFTADIIDLAKQYKLSLDSKAVEELFSSNNQKLKLLSSKSQDVIETELL